MYKTMSLLVGLAIALGVLTSSTRAFATIIESDDPLFGLGSITRDTATGLDWLDLTKTENLTFNFVTSQLGTGGMFAGLRYASGIELTTLMQDAMIPVVPGIDSSNKLPVEALIQKLGNLGTLDFEFTQGILKDDFGSLKWVGLLLVSGDFGYAIPFSGMIGKDTSLDSVGSFLVRESSVPEPATFCLLASGLAWLAFTRARPH